MTLLVTPTEFDARRAIVAGPLRPLALSLAAELEPLLDREPFIPPDKALLSRAGGRCPADGVLLEFDPWSPRAHRCPLCGEVYQQESHYRFWVYWYQLWLAERAVHAALLAGLGVDERFGTLARDVLRGYADAYLAYPNRDNVLGPTRLFFSTYIESIWLLQICVATHLLERAGDRSIGEAVRDGIIEPARELIAIYDEGQSNRQVWNNAALLASALLLNNAPAAEGVVFGASGIASHLGVSLLSDGTWYEGENYHLFAHRGLWYGITMAERAGLELPAALTHRFQEGFAAPLLTAYPDLTLPSRRDSQFAISLRQWRIAEHLELGVARTRDERLLGALSRIYHDELPRRDTGRWRAAADVERNVPPSALSRADLSWRALLHALPELPAADSTPTRSALLDAQGIAVFRRETAYVALDYGHGGGGHGHPDRLNVLLVDGSTRWLDDMGTGSYVHPSLHWYRSTLAHNAPLVNGRSQSPVHGRLLAHDERGDVGWVSAAVEEIFPGVSAARTLVVAGEYVIDELRWRADTRVTVDLPLHIDAAVVAGVAPGGSGMPYGRDGLEDGFRFLREATYEKARAGDIVQMEAILEGRKLHGWVASDRDVQWWRAVAPGPPGEGERAFRMLRAAGDSGIHRIVWTWSESVASVSFDDGRIVVTHRDGRSDSHTRVDAGWRMERRGTAHDTIVELGGWCDDESDEQDLRVPDVPANPPPVLVRGQPRVADLGLEQYRRSEESWDDAGRPEAIVSILWTGDVLRVRVDVPRSDLTFVPADAENPYDNEHPAINGDGVQLYLFTPGDLAGWLLVPDEASRVRVRQIDGWKSERAISAVWRRAGNGYELEAELPFSTREAAVTQIGLDVIVNEKPAGRERRRGQLVLSGAVGEFVYLRGDRHDPSRLVSFLLSDV